MKKLETLGFIFLVATGAECATISTLKEEDAYIRRMEERLKEISSTDQQIIERLRLVIARADLTELRNEIEKRDFRLIRDNEQRKFWSGVLNIATIYRHCAKCSVRVGCIGKKGYSDPMTPEHDGYLICDRYLMSYYPGLYRCQ